MRGHPKRDYTADGIPTCRRGHINPQRNKDRSCVTCKQINNRIPAARQDEEKIYVSPVVGNAAELLHKPWTFQS